MQCLNECDHKIKSHLNDRTFRTGCMYGLALLLGDFEFDHGPRSVLN
jgi:hypothetical protein